MDERRFPPKDTHTVSIRAMPDHLWADVKSTAASSRQTAQEFVIAALTLAVGKQ